MILIISINVYSFFLPIDLRLVGGSSPNEGRVEVLYNGEWGTVCDNGWDNRDAKVVCRQLGYSDVGAIGTAEANFGQGSGNILIDNADCTGTKTSLDQCRLRMGLQVCWTHSRDAGVICGNKTGKYVRNSSVLAHYSVLALRLA